MFIKDFIISFTLQLLCMFNYDIIILVNKFFFAVFHITIF
uniref:Uncharacterized protein n=1 Tax=Laurencia australis TaxID=3073067 RepID=A0AA51RFJ3_9FLOR|nr:hypothetical protein [Laurencia australis]WMP12063.1 hypothetical protein [Laurencia australis]